MHQNVTTIGRRAGTTLAATAIALASLAPTASAGGEAGPRSAKLPTPTAEQARQFSSAKHLLAKIEAGSASSAEIEDFVKNYPLVAKVVGDPSKSETTVKEAVITEDGEAVSPRSGKPLSATELAEVAPPAEATESDHAEEEEAPEEADVAPAAQEVGADSGRIRAAKVKGGKWKMTHITHTHRSYLGQTILKYHTYARFNYKGGKVRAWGKRYDRFSNEADVVKVGSRIENRKSKVPAASATSLMKRHVELCFAGSIGCYANIYPWAKVKVYGNGKTKVAGSGA